MHPYSFTDDRAIGVKVVGDVEGRPPTLRVLETDRRRTVAARRLLAVDPDDLDYAGDVTAIVVEGSAGKNVITVDPSVTQQELLSLDCGAVPRQPAAPSHTSRFTRARAMTRSTWSGRDGRHVPDGHPAVRRADGNDAIAGTAGRGVVYAGAGNDRVSGRGGNDRLVGGAGDATGWTGARATTCWKVKRRGTNCTARRATITGTAASTTTGCTATLATPCAAGRGRGRHACRQRRR